MKINFKDGVTPVFDQNYRSFAPNIKYALMAELKALVVSGVIKLVKQQDLPDVTFAAPVVLVPKSSGG